VLVAEPPSPVRDALRGIGYGAAGPPRHKKHVQRPDKQGGVAYHRWLVFPDGLVEVGTELLLVSDGHSGRGGSGGCPNALRGRGDLAEQLVRLLEGLFHEKLVEAFACLSRKALVLEVGVQEVVDALHEVVGLLGYLALGV